jgi:hypothetical protein
MLMGKKVQRKEGRKEGSTQLTEDVNNEDAAVIL